MRIALRLPNEDWKHSPGSGLVHRCKVGIAYKSVSNQRSAPPLSLLSTLMSNKDYYGQQPGGYPQQQQQQYYPPQGSNSVHRYQRMS